MSPTDGVLFITPAVPRLVNEIKQKPKTNGKKIALIAEDMFTYEHGDSLLVAAHVARRAASKEEFLDSFDARMKLPNTQREILVQDEQFKALVQSEKDKAELLYYNMPAIIEVSANGQPNELVPLFPELSIIAHFQHPKEWGRPSRA